MRGFAELGGGFNVVGDGDEFVEPVGDGTGAGDDPLEGAGTEGFPEEPPEDDGVELPVESDDPVGEEVGWPALVVTDAPGNTVTRVTGTKETDSVKAETEEDEDIVPNASISVSVQLDVSPLILHWMSTLAVTPLSTKEPTKCAVEGPSDNVKVGAGPSSPVDPRTI